MSPLSLFQISITIIFFPNNTVIAGRIDMAHHSNAATLALTDTLALDAAVTMAKWLTDDQDTLTIVTADHSHTMTIGGYPDRGVDILGKEMKISPHTFAQYVTTHSAFIFLEKFGKYNLLALTSGVI